MLLDRYDCRLKPRTKHVPSDNKFGRAMLLARFASAKGMLERY